MGGSLSVVVDDHRELATARLFIRNLLKTTYCHSDKECHRKSRHHVLDRQRTISQLRRRANFASPLPTDRPRGLDIVQFSLDREHNFMSKKILTKLIPSLIYEAHELCKAIGKKLEMELRSMVVARLQDLRKSKLKASDVEFTPVDTMSYIRKHASQWQRVHPRAAVYC